ncbi:sugar phosphate isomerase/epimerase [Aquimarina sp. TRL1]|uniref:sugar phosphate isomerase/epimerase family protein n=1 Tax=Aquimarina sp. (strain TRL1) TaxID=2736252 RepID=UPI00158C73F8|nr:sugar phosphate isomerase/epimerase [Aquimarina sp. TRL1]QKX05678.1 sugar phosphate isomerase/epimerase [Aquimarina sp. TRL1]
MEIKFIYPRWGSGDVNWTEFFKKVKEAGYDGVEIDLPLRGIEKYDVLNRLKDYELEFVGQHWETKDVKFSDHKENFKRHLYNLVEAEPLFVNSHTGMDFFSFSQNGELLLLAEEIEDETGVRIIHETHRSRFCFAAHIGALFLKEFPFLKLTADFSHWCCVAESLLENQKVSVEKAIDHSFHIHARVGSSQSPQIIDPRDELYKEEFTVFMGWWNKIIDKALSRKDDYITITPEYGPFPYTLYAPNTTQALGNQWEINEFIRKEIMLKRKQVLGSV